MGKNGSAQSDYETLKLNVSQEWTVGMNKSTKVKSWFNSFQIGIFLVLHETLKSAVA